MFRGTTLLLAALLSFQANAADWTITPADSEISFSGTHVGNAFEGKFETWSADISFDADDLSSARVRIEVNTDSALTGNALYDGTLKGDDWFNVAAYPDAVFEAADFTKVGEGVFRASGTLTVKDASVPLLLDFELEIDGDSATMRAAPVLDRIALGLGVRSDADASWVSKEIALKVQVQAIAR